MYSLIIVDDEDLPRNSLKKYIEKEHPAFEVAETFYDGQEAWDYMQTSHVDVVITDIRMPTMDGLELAKLVTEHFPNVVIIIISSYSEFDYARKAIQCRSVVEYLLKPLDYHELSACLNMILQKTENPEVSCGTHSQTVNAPQELQGLQEAQEPEYSNTDMTFAVEYIHANFARSITREDLANLLFLSPSYFSRIFKLHTGQSFSEYLRTVRMEKACELLATRCKVKDIARQVGYQSNNRFFVVFQQCFGCTPSEYRHRIISNSRKDLSK